MGICKGKATDGIDPSDLSCNYAVLATRGFPWTLARGGVAETLCWRRQLVCQMSQYSRVPFGIWRQENRTRG